MVASPCIGRERTVNSPIARAYPESQRRRVGRWAPSKAPWPRHLGQSPNRRSLGYVFPAGCLHEEGKPITPIGWTVAAIWIILEVQKPAGHSSHIALPLGNLHGAISRFSNLLVFISSFLSFAKISFVLKDLLTRPAVFVSDSSCQYEHDLWPSTYCWADSQ